MKKIGLILFSVAAISSSVDAFDYCNATTNYYDNCGRRTGSATERPYGTVDYYDNCGKRIGSASKTSYGAVNYYDNCGKLVGSSN